MVAGALLPHGQVWDSSQVLTGISLQNRGIFGLSSIIPTGITSGDIPVMYCLFVCLSPQSDCELLKAKSLFFFPPWKLFNNWDVLHSVPAADIKYRVTHLSCFQDSGRLRKVHGFAFSYHMVNEAKKYGQNSSEEWMDCTGSSCMQTVNLCNFLNCEMGNIIPTS